MCLTVCKEVLSVFDYAGEFFKLLDIFHLFSRFDLFVVKFCGKGICEWCLFAIALAWVLIMFREQPQFHYFLVFH